MNIDKYFRVHAEINLDKIYSNIEKLKNNTKNGTMIAAIIKADGYGHGAVPIAQKCDDIVDYYAVATIDEALNLRRHGINKPILIIGYIHYIRNEEAIENDIRLTVYSYEMAEYISDAASKLNKNAKVHIKLDTGMNRIGFKCNESSLNDIEKINNLPYIEIEGIFTHFFAADEKNKSSATQQQQMYNKFLDELENKGLYFPIKHCSNSAATMEIPFSNMNMVRVGIAIYGLWPSNEVEKDSVLIEPALKLKSHIINIKDIKKGETVSYGATYTAKEDMKIATIPVGYGDGFQRNLSNKGRVLIKGKSYPIVGRICMDQFMVDISKSSGIQLFDEVTLIGKDMDEIITVEELGDLSGVFNYEFVCDLGKRIPRVYYSNGNIIGTKDYFLDDYFQI